MIKKFGLGFMRDKPEDVQKKIDYAMEVGINYFESCRFYINNRCEQLVGEALKKYNREDYILCAKMPVLGELESRPPNEIFEDQLKNLNTGYFDYYLLQALDRNSLKILRDTKAIQYLIEQKKNGRIKSLGFSFHDTLPFLKMYLDLYDWDCVQIQLNYYDWFLGEAQKLVQELKSRDIPIFVMGASKGGTLVNNLPEKARDFLHRENPYYTCLDFLSSIDVDMVLLGGNSVNEILNTLQWSEAYVSFDDLRAIIEEYKKTDVIGCTSCRYCETVCPRSIPLGTIFKLYNNILEKSNDKDYDEYRKIQKSKYSGFNCIGCGSCEKKCPQHLNIRELLRTKIFTLRL